MEVEKIKVTPLYGKNGKKIAKIAGVPVTDIADITLLEKAEANLKHNRTKAAFCDRPDIDAHIKAVQVQKGRLMENLTPEEIRKFSSGSGVVSVEKGKVKLNPDKSLEKKFSKFSRLVPTMKAALESMGVNPSNDLPTLVNQFYNEVVCSEKGVEKGQPNLGKKYKKINLATSSYDSVDDYGDVISSAIVDFVKVARNKEQAGAPLSKVEKIVAQGANKVQTQIEQKAKDEAAGEVGNQILFSRKTQLIILAVLAGIVAITWAIAK